MEIAKQPRRTKEEIVTMMEEFTSSGAMSVTEFCEMQQISRTAFYHWQKIDRAYHQEKEGGSSFISLNVTGHCEERIFPILFAEVRGIRIYRGVSAENLKDLMPRVVCSIPRNSC